MHTTPIGHQKYENASVKNGDLNKEYENTKNDPNSNVDYDYADMESRTSGTINKTSERTDYEPLNELTRAPVTVNVPKVYDSLGAK